MKVVGSGAGRLLSALLLLMTACSGGASPRQPAVETAQPNILYILTDDLDAAAIQYMPHLQEMLVAQGLSFTNYFVTDSLCCPSRSSILRGQFPHNTEVIDNMPPNGGFEKFHSLGHEDSTMGTWLQSAGYRTGLMGKYLNGYLLNGGSVPLTYVPPGWDEWDGAGNAYAEFNYQLNENGKLVSYGRQPEDYLVDVESRKATDFVNGAARDGVPFFLYLATFAPHQPATPAPRHENLFQSVQAPRTPSFNEGDVSDKPEWLSSRSSLRPPQIRQIDELYRKRLQSLQSVDEMIASLVDTLRANGQLDRTYIVFNSDNGFHLGQHRLTPGKQTAYDEDIRVPLIVRGPGVPAGRTATAIAMNIDLAPTFAAIAGAVVPDFVDGRSLLPLFDGAPAPVDWRTAAVIEHFGGASDPDDPDNDDEFLQGTPLGPNAGDAGQGARPGAPGRPGRQPVGGQPPTQPRGITTYQALRTAGFLYVEYTTGEHELYSIADDPYELNNIYGQADLVLLQRLDAQLKAISACAGESCRAVDRV